MYRIKRPYSVLYYKTENGFVPCNAKVFTGDIYKLTDIYYKITEDEFIRINGEKNSKEET